MENNKQITLEEASWKFNPIKKLDGEFLRHAFKEGAKWQQERMYSEEEVIAFAQWMYDYKGDINKVEELFEQFKKK